MFFFSPLCFLLSLSISSFYMDSPPNRSLGRNELRLEGVARAGSVLSREELVHRLEGLLDQPVLHVSPPGLEEELRHPPEEPPC